jgi:hypothetical protein
MYLVYFDESGDDGIINSSSHIFVLTGCYFHYLKWKEIFESIKEFRYYLKKEFNIPMKIEIKAKHFILNKNPYKDFNFSNEIRILIFKKIANFIGNLHDIKFINVLINKKVIENENYPILENSLKYNIQRIENDLESYPVNRFLIITDQGRVGKMQKITRKIQRYNPIPSKYSDGFYRKEIKLMIEDPLPKNSKESYFIQLCDYVSYVIGLYGIKKYLNGNWAKRLRPILNYDNLIEILNLIKPVLNLRANPKDEYGLVCYPK